MNSKLSFTNTATDFANALPIGNGSFGSMVYSGFPDFHYSINHDTLWSGTRKNDSDMQTAESVLIEARSLIDSGHYYEADNYIVEKMLGEYGDSYLSAGFLQFHFDVKDESFTDCNRTLDFASACAFSDIKTKELGCVTTESFVSCSENVLVINVFAERSATMHISSNSLLHYTLKSDSNSILLMGEAPYFVAPNYVVDAVDPVRYGNGMKFSFLCSVSDTDGQLSTDSRGLVLSGFTHATFITSIETGFRGWNVPLEHDISVLGMRCKITNLEVSKLSFAELKYRNSLIFSQLYNRVHLDLGSNPEYNNLPSDERLHLLINDAERDDNGFYELMFNFGRYMEICSSRNAGVFSQPANLQGIWCEDVRSIWSSNWTTNINIEMNHWMNGPCDLDECNLPLFTLLKDLSEAGASTAKNVFHSQGWCSCHNIDLWRKTTPTKGKVRWAYWPMSGVWMTTHLYQQYLYTLDEEFLRKNAYPIMKSAAAFCLNWLQPGNDGLLHTLPSTSPENEFIDKEGRVCGAARSSTLDILLIRELLSNTLASAKLLGDADDYIELLQDTLRKLPDYKVSKTGGICEWFDDPDQFDVGHRHLSPLVGMFPYWQINTDDTPALVDAARKFVELRTQNWWLSLEWAEIFVAGLYCRMHDGDKAESYLRMIIRDCMYDNLMTYHRPLGENSGERAIFQIDGVLGLPYVLTQFIVQSNENIVYLLPAIPHKWDSGNLSGVRIKGACKINISWSDGKLKKANLFPEKNRPITLIYDKPFEMETEQGCIVSSKLTKGRFSIQYKLQAGNIYSIRA